MEIDFILLKARVTVLETMILDTAEKQEQYAKLFNGLSAEMAKTGETDGSKVLQELIDKHLEDFGKISQARALLKRSGDE